MSPAGTKLSAEFEIGLGPTYCNPGKFGGRINFAVASALVRKIKTRKFSYLWGGNNLRFWVSANLKCANYVFCGEKTEYPQKKNPAAKFFRVISIKGSRKHSSIVRNVLCRFCPCPNVKRTNFFHSVTNELHSITINGNGVEVTEWSVFQVNGS